MFFASGKCEAKCRSICDQVDSLNTFGCNAQLTALTSGLMTKLWGTTIDEYYIHVLCNLGPLVYFEGLLSLYGSEADMWGDMCVAIEDLCAVSFTLVRSNIHRYNKPNQFIPTILCTVN